jgi:DNA-directed RNA polymerase alpha subunit
MTPPRKSPMNLKKEIPHVLKSRKGLIPRGLMSRQPSKIIYKRLSKGKRKQAAGNDEAEKESTFLPEFLITPIDRTSLSSRVKNVCWNANISTVSDLIDHSRNSFGRLRNSGKKCGDEVEAFLGKIGLSWKPQREREELYENEVINGSSFSEYL